jgi:hypothetical protein
MRTPDRDLLAVVAELQQAIAAGREPNFTDAERASLAAYICKQSKPDRRGKSRKRHFQAANRRMLRGCMEFIKIKMRRDPAEREARRAMHASGEEYYNLNKRVAQRMHKRLVKAGCENPPTVAALQNILRRSTAIEPDDDCYT